MKTIKQNFSAMALFAASALFIIDAGAQQSPQITQERLKEAPISRGLVVTPVLKASTTVLGQPIEYTKTDSPEVVSVTQSFEKGGETGWHYHIHSSHIYVLEGTLELEMLDGTKKSFTTGQAYMESVNTWHNGRNKGSGPLKLLVVSFIEKGKSNNVFGEVK
ncbi:cupin domain-containing protein [Duganella callida]|nr:cupin domain-containing protein [Duganella callida]